MVPRRRLARALHVDARDCLTPGVVALHTPSSRATITVSRQKSTQSCYDYLQSSAMLSNRHSLGNESIDDTMLSRGGNLLIIKYVSSMLTSFNGIHKYVSYLCLSLGTHPIDDGLLHSDCLMSLLFTHYVPQCKLWKMPKKRMCYST